MKRKGRRDERHVMATLATFSVVNDKGHALILGVDRPGSIAISLTNPGRVSSFDFVEIERAFVAAKAYMKGLES